jgi:hypothetical protein
MNSTFALFSFPNKLILNHGLTMDSQLLKISGSSPHSSYQQCGGTNQPFFYKLLSINYMLFFIYKSEPKKETIIVCFLAPYVSGFSTLKV